MIKTHNTYFSSRPRLVIACLVFGFSLASSVCMASGQITVEQILSAWSDRTAEIDSFEYVCEIVDESAGPWVRKRRDPFHLPSEDELNNGDREVVRVTKEMKLKQRGKDMIYRLTGDFCNRDTGITSWQEHVSLRKGNIAKKLHLRADSKLALGSFSGPAQRTFRNVYTAQTVPVLLWCEQEYVLVTNRVDTASLEIIAPEVVLPDGTDGVRISGRIFRGGAITILVSQESPHLPIEWTRTHSEGFLLDQYKIGYARDSKGQLLLDDWSYQRFDAQGRLRNTRNGRTTTCKLGVELADSEFDFEFPVGTHIVEHTGRKARKYWIQESPAKRRRIDETEYGQSPKRRLDGRSTGTHRLPSWITMAVTTIPVVSLQAAGAGHIDDPSADVSD